MPTRAGLYSPNGVRSIIIITLNCIGNCKRYNYCNNYKLIKHVANYKYRAIEVKISDLDRRSVRNLKSDWSDWSDVR